MGRNENGQRSRGRKGGNTHTDHESGQTPCMLTPRENETTTTEEPQRCSEGSGPGNECFICLEAKEDLIHMKECCSGHVCGTCLEKWVETRVVWPAERGQEERCPRCRQPIADEDALELIKVALDKRQYSSTLPSSSSSPPSLWSSWFSLLPRSLPSLVGTFNELKTDVWKFFRTNACPSCQRIIYRDGGCPNMTCRCGFNFKWFDPKHSVAVLSVFFPSLWLATYLRDGGLTWMLPCWIRVSAAALLYLGSAAALVFCFDSKAPVRLAANEKRNRHAVLVLTMCWLFCAWPALATMYCGCSLANAAAYWKEVAQRGFFAHCRWLLQRTPIGTIGTFVLVKPTTPRNRKRPFKRVVTGIAGLCLASFCLVQGANIYWHG